MTLFLSMLGEALQAMAANKLRTFLTALGIIIGVGAVVLMVALGQGTQSAVAKSIAGLGSNLLIIRSASPRPPRPASTPAPAACRRSPPRTPRRWTTCPASRPWPPWCNRAHNWYTARTTGAPWSWVPTTATWRSATGRSQAAGHSPTPSRIPACGSPFWAGRWPNNCSARPTRSANSCASKNRLIRSSAYWPRKASPWMAATRTTPSSSPCSPPSGNWSARSSKAPYRPSWPRPSRRNCSPPARNKSPTSCTSGIASRRGQPGRASTLAMASRLSSITTRVCMSDSSRTAVMSVKPWTLSLTSAAMRSTSSARLTP